MDATKKLLRNLPEHLFYFLAADIVCMLLTWAVNLMVRPLLMELSRGNAQTEATIETVLFVVFALLFLAVLAAIFAKSPIQRTGYLAATIDREYSFGRDLKVFLAGGIWVGGAAYAIFSLVPTFFLWLFPDISYLPTLFYPQYALAELLGVWIAYGVGIVAYMFFSLLLFPCLHWFWEKKRLHH